MADKYIIEIRVKGENFNPEIVRLKEIADFVIAFEQMIASIVARNNPSLAFSEDDVVLGLSSITQGSLIQRYVTQYETEVSQAYSVSAAAISNETYDGLPGQAIEALYAIRKFNRDHNTRTEFWQQNGATTQLATITGQTRISVETFIIRGSTTLYGDLLRIGGEDPPRALIRFLDGTQKSCRVRSTTLARQMAQFLYQRIGVRGIAQWDTRDMTLYEFRIEELQPYRQTTLAQAMASLREVAGEYYDQIDDVEALIKDIRGNDENDQ